MRTIFFICLRISIQSLLLFTLSSPSYGGTCQPLFQKPTNEKHKQNNFFTKKFNRILSAIEKGGNIQNEINTFKKRSFGNWIETPTDSIHYKWYDSTYTNSVMIFVGGLNSSLMGLTPQENKVIQSHLKNLGPVLVVEMQGQGETEVLHQLQHSTIPYFHPFLEKKKTYGLHYNKTKLIGAFHQVLKEKGWHKKPLVFSGHSFGAMIIGVLGHHIPPNSHINLFAPGITHYNNDLSLKPKEFNLIHETINHMDYWNSHKKRQKASLSSLKKAPFKEKIREDRIINEASQYLTLSSHNMDMKRNMKNLRNHISIHVFTGANDTVVFPMSHYELIKTLKGFFKSETAIAGFLLEKVNHNVTADLSPLQEKALTNIANKTQHYNGFYKIFLSGQVKKLSDKEAETLYKKHSLEMWKKNEEWLKEFFSNYNIHVEFPKKWHLK